MLHIETVTFLTCLFNIFTIEVFSIPISEVSILKNTEEVKKIKDFPEWDASIVDFENDKDFPKKAEFPKVDLPINKMKANISVERNILWKKIYLAKFEGQVSLFHVSKESDKSHQRIIENSDVNKTRDQHKDGNQPRDGKEGINKPSTMVCKGEECEYINVVIKARSKRRKRELSERCYYEVKLEVFGIDYMLCLITKSFRNESIFDGIYDRLNMTIFSDSDTTMNIPINTLDLEYITGNVVDEPFSSVNGYLINLHFFGFIYIQDHMHFLEPSLKKSKDLHIYLNGKKRFLHQEQNKNILNKIQIKKTQNDIPHLTCNISIVADHTFYDQVGHGSLHETVLQLLWLIKEANNIWMSLDFDDDSISDCIKLSIGEITIFTSDNSMVNLLTGQYNLPEDYLKRLSRYNFDGYCMGVLLTNRYFDDLVLGLSWRGNPKPGGVGGICERRVRILSDENAYSFNALFVTFRSTQETRIPLKMGVLNLVHEMLHSFGATHDPAPSVRKECTPGDKWINGRFLMSKFSNDGHKINHRIMSQCTKDLVLANLASTTRTSCLASSQTPQCGDGLVQGDEQCDCGTILRCILTRSCCVPPEGRGSSTPCTWRSDLTNCTRPVWPTITTRKPTADLQVADLLSQTKQEADLVQQEVENLLSAIRRPTFTNTARSGSISPSPTSIGPVSSTPTSIRPISPIPRSNRTPVSTTTKTIERREYTSDTLLPSSNISIKEHIQQLLTEMKSLQEHLKQVKKEAQLEEFPMDGFRPLVTIFVFIIISMLLILTATGALHQALCAELSNLGDAERA